MLSYAEGAFNMAGAGSGTTQLDNDASQFDTDEGNFQPSTDQVDPQYWQSVTSDIVALVRDCPRSKHYSRKLLGG